MAELLIEFFSEEIPSRFQKTACLHLQKAIEDILTDEALTFTQVNGFVTPRRLGCVVHNVALKGKQHDIVKKGPRVEAPQKAIEGFLRSNNLTIDQLEKRELPEGNFYYAVWPGQSSHLDNVISKKLPRLIQTFPWPTSMRWGQGRMRWVRPLHSMICIISGDDVENGMQVIPVDIEGVPVSNVTYGRRCTGTKPLHVRNFAEYQAVLKQAGIILAADERHNVIIKQLKELCRIHNVQLCEDDDLLEEVVGLTQAPYVIIGKVDERFHAVPDEVLKTSLRNHQKFFCAYDRDSQRLTHFLLVANVQPIDGDEFILRGNYRVMKARLEDAVYFWKQDQQSSLEERLDALQDVRFHSQLGSQLERVYRLCALSQRIATLIGGDPVSAYRAAKLCKSDLLTEMVGEFPELQGIMGRYYALHDGEQPEVARAISDHYRPAGVGDSAVMAAVGLSVGLADRLDQLAAFWVIDCRPTGSKDPYGLRRAALGIIRLILENSLRIDLRPLLHDALIRAGLCVQIRKNKALYELASPILMPLIRRGHSSDQLVQEARTLGAVDDCGFLRSVEKWTDNLLQFIKERLNHYIRDQQGSNYHPGIVRAVLHTNITTEYDLLMLSERLHEVDDFIRTPEGKRLLSLYKRSANLLRNAEKDPNFQCDGRWDKALFKTAQEQTLAEIIMQVTNTVQTGLDDDAFTTVMQELLRLSEPVSQFFDAVMINDNDEAIRKNRLALLFSLRALFHRVANFGMID